MIITQTPFRMSFFGGGTDMESFFRENGGAVLSTTFDKYCYVNVRHLPRFFDYSTELSYSKTERVTCIEDIQHPAIRNAMKMLDILFLIKSKGKFNKENFTYLITLLAIIAIGLIGNIAFSYQKSVSAIIRDIVGFIKFPIVFLALYRMNLGKYLSHKMEKLIPVIKIIVWVIFAFGLLSVFVDIGMSQEEVRGLIHPYMFLYTHPTYLTTGLICILCILNTTGAATIKEDIVILGSVALAMRTKGLVFIAVYIFLKYGSRWLRKFKIFYWFAIIGIVLIVASSKLQMYASFSNSPRESLYVGAITLFKDCFPIGSGFASFASHISGKYFSGVYNVIHIAGLYSADGQISPDIGDRA